MAKGQAIVLTDEQRQYVIDHFATDAACDIADHLGYSAPYVLSVAKKMGLKKADGWNHGQFRNRIVRTYRHERYANYKYGEGR